MTWNYIVSREQYEGEDGEKIDQFGMREIYYSTEEGENKIGWTEKTIEPHGDTFEELIDCLAFMLNDAQSRGILDLTLDPPQVVGVAADFNGRYLPISTVVPVEMRVAQPYVPEPREATDES